MSDRKGLADVVEARRIVACHLPIPECPDTVCLPITMTAGDLRLIYESLEVADAMYRRGEP